jgi:hypothetical protein
VDKKQDSKKKNWEHASSDRALAYQTQVLPQKKKSLSATFAGL